MMNENESDKTYKFIKIFVLGVAAFSLLFLGYIYYQRAEIESNLIIITLGLVGLYLSADYYQKKSQK